MLNKVISCDVAYVSPVCLAEAVLILTTSRCTRYLSMRFHDVINVCTIKFKIAVCD